jgi:CheY-like chemotaxis protein
METNRPRVLVIDDEPIHADTLAMVLNISGFEATAVYSGERGLELVQQCTFDHLVTDVVMSGMNGIDAAIAIRQVLPTCRVLLISGNNDTTKLLDLAAAKGHAFEILAKPVHPTVLIGQMRAQSPVTALIRSRKPDASSDQTAADDSRSLASRR